MTTIVVVYALLGSAAMITMFPLVWMLAASFMSTGEATVYPPHLTPHTLSPSHYIELFTRLRVGRYVINSTVVAAGVTLSAVVLNSLAGYAFAKLRFAGRDRTFRVLLTAMLVPAQVSMLPLFLLIKSLGLLNTYWGVMVPGLASVFGIFLVRQYAQSIPDSLLDAARIDGAGELRIYWSLVLPLCRPVLVTLAIFTFMGTWNDFMWPLIVLADADMHTLPVALASLLGEHAQDTELMMAGSVLTVLPVLLVFLALQRHYVAGLMSGGVKA